MHWEQEHVDDTVVYGLDLTMILGSLKDLPLVIGKRSLHQISPEPARPRDVLENFSQLGTSLCEQNVDSAAEQ